MEKGDKKYEEDAGQKKKATGAKKAGIPREALSRCLLSMAILSIYVVRNLDPAA